MVSTPSSNYIQSIESKIVFDLCAGKFFIDASDTIVSNVNKIAGINFKVIDPYGAVLKDYPSSGYDTLYTDISTPIQVDIPEENNNFIYGLYDIFATVKDIDNKVFTIEKLVDVSEPDKSNILRSYGTIGAFLDAICGIGKLFVKVNTPPPYSGKVISSSSQSYTLDYPTGSGLPTSSHTINSFSAPLFEGVYILKGILCATYSMGDDVFAKIPYKVNTRKEVFCSVDQCAVLDVLDVIYQKLESCLESDRELYSSLFVEAVGLIKLIELSGACGKDPSDYAEKLRIILGVSGVDLNNGTYFIGTALTSDTFITVATKADAVALTFTGDNVWVKVTSDESNNNDKSMYHFDGTTLEFQYTIA